MWSRRCSRHRRGNTALILGLSLLALIGFSALAVDVGTLQVARAQLQAVTDVSALAAASRIDGTDAAFVEIPEFAVAMGARNVVFREPVGIDRANVITGVWDPVDGSFTPSVDPVEVNAVRVHAERPGVPTPFAGIAFAEPLFSVRADSIAVRPLEPALRLDCYLPVALPECTWQQMLDSGDQEDHHFYFSADSPDNVGWAHPESPTPASIDQALRDVVEGVCDDGANMIEVGAPISLANGVQASTITYLGDALEDSPTPWAPSLFGPRPAQDAHSVFPPATYPHVGVIEGPVPIFEYGGQCGGVKFAQEQTIVALAWGVIFDAYSGPGQHKGFQMYVDTDHVWTVPDGEGGGTGNVFTHGPARLVYGGVR